MRRISIDIETFSSVNLIKSGLYRYAQSPDFQVLLFAYSIDEAPVQVIDLTQVNSLPDIVLQCLFDPATIKQAYNAAFEWYCLSKYFGLLGRTDRPPEAWLSQWHCTMLHGLYCGYTTGLAATGKAMGLPQDKRKMTEGNALIRYFCIPCKPTKTNGNRMRNLPHHDPGKWELFRQYCAQDVVTEMEIERRLQNFPVPDLVQAQWVTDQIINARGVAVDTNLVDGALWCGDTTRKQLMEEATMITSLDNPNSIAQLTCWLEEETESEIDNLRKDTVIELLDKGVNSEAAQRMLEIRQELGKTSTKKYNALETAVCADGRVRGLLQFYGANRTGRWAGRIVQPQNLPRTHLEPLALARELVKDRRMNALELIYGSIPDTLSQLIRTALVAAEGHMLVDADFSAIEARVIAWLAGEEWVLEVFRTHGRIYEATASQMFGVPLPKIVKGQPEYELRQKGKVATLALGYQGSVGALQSMRKTYNIPEAELPDAELPDIVRRWRQSNRRIVDLWYAVENAAFETVRTGKPVQIRCLIIARVSDPANGQDFMTIALPNGRKLYYARPHFGLNRFGKEAVCYYGMNQTSKKWEVVETYGGKLVENCVQAIARDCLAEAVTRLEALGYPVVFHVHDEVILEVPAERADLDRVTGIMAEPVAWAPGLPMNADGWVNEFYKKD